MGLTARNLVIELGLLALVILVVAVLGPFGSSNIGPLPARLVYWGAVIPAGYALMRPVIAFAPSMSRRLAMPELAVWIGLTLVLAFPLTWVVWRTMGGRQPPTAAQLLEFYPNVALLALLVNLVFWAVRRRPEDAERNAAAAPPPAAPSLHEPAAPPAPPAPAGPRLLERLPPHQRGAIRALEMEDHYVRVHTDAGSALILMRLRDAIAELDGLAGAQVHRSWWVARDAVDAVQPEGRNLRVHLSGGLVAPVARAQVAPLRDAGWPL